MLLNIIEKPRPPTNEEIVSKAVPKVLDTVALYTTFVSKRFNVIRERGSALSDNEIVTSRIVSMLPVGLREKRETAIEEILKQLPVLINGSDRDNDKNERHFLNLMLASMCVLDPSHVSPMKMRDVISPILRSSSHSSSDGVDSVLLACHAMKLSGHYEEASAALERLIDSSAAKHTLLMPLQPHQEEGGNGDTTDAATSGSADELVAAGARLTRLVMVVDLLGRHGAETLSQSALSTLSSALVETLRPMRSHAASSAHFSTSLATLRHLWEGLAPLSDSLPDSYIIHSALFYLVSKAVHSQPFQLGYAPGTPLSLLQAMAHGPYKDGQLAQQIMTIMHDNRYYHMGQRYQLKFVDALASLGEEASALALLAHYSEQAYAAGGTADQVTATVNGAVVPLSHAALELVHRHLVSYPASQRYEPADLVLAMLCFSRHPKHHRSASAARGGHEQAHYFGMARAPGDPYAKLLSTVETDVMSQLDAVGTENSSSSSSSSSSFGLTACAQMLSCYGQVGRRQDSIIALLNARVGALLQEQRSADVDPTRTTQQRARLLQGVLWANARVGVCPPYLDAAVEELLEYFYPLSLGSTAGLSNPSSGNKNKAVSRMNGVVSLLWSLSVLGRLDIATFSRLEPIITMYSESGGSVQGNGRGKGKGKDKDKGKNKGKDKDKGGGHRPMTPQLSTALERVLCGLRLEYASSSSSSSSLSPVEQEYLARIRPWEASVQARNSAAHIPSSSMHMDVSRTLRGLGISHKNEVRVTGGYTVDVLIPENNTQQCAIALEIDGPFHYDTYHSSPLGATAAKRRHLRQLGYEVATIPFWQWDTHTLSRGEKEKRVKHALREAGYKVR
jgi:hypothetical protein